MGAISLESNASRSSLSGDNNDLKCSCSGSDTDSVKYSVINFKETEEVLYSYLCLKCKYFQFQFYEACRRINLITSDWSLLKIALCWM